MTGTAREVTLLVPGLAGPDDPGAGDPRVAARLLTEGLRLDALACMLGRAGDEPHALQAPTLDGLLFEAFHVPRSPDGDWPAGAVSRQALAGDAGAGAWLRADPVHLRADMGRLILFPPQALDLTLDESARIAEWLNAHPHAPGPVVEPATAWCWHARVDPAPRLRTVAPSQAHGQDADACLPRGPDAAAWHARMNEVQMLLHECPVNAEREARGAPAVNSLWFWGGGVLPAVAGGAHDAAWGDDPVLAGLAATAGIPVQPLPGAGARWLAAAAPGTHLLALDTLERPAVATDLEAWRDALAALERDWLVPLAGALRRGRIARIQVHAGGGAGVSVSRRDLRRWWRRTPPLAESLARLRRRGQA